MYQYLLLDLDNTVLDFDAAELSCFKQLLNHYQLEFNQQRLDNYRKINHQLWASLEREEITKEQLFQQRFRLFFKEEGLAINGIEAEEIFRLSLNKAAHLLPNTKVVLTELKNRGKKIYAATNGVYETQMKRLAKANILSFFDGLFISEIVGYEKPSEHFFNHCMLHLPTTDINQVLMVGDSVGSDINGANNFGIDSCYLNRKKLVCNQATYNISELKMLLDIV